MSEQPKKGTEPAPVPKGLRLDYFVDPACRIYQNPKHFCFNSDSTALAEFVSVCKGERIAEIGTNNGALLVYLSRFAPQSVTGIEILPEPARLARQNLETFARCPGTVFEEDAKEFAQKNRGAFDLVVCNPPFFPLLPGQEKQALSLRQLGRFEKNLDLAGMVEAASLLLRSKGRFCFVHRPQRLAEAITQLQSRGFALNRLQIVYDARDNEAKAILLEAVKEGNCETRVEPPLFRK